MNERLGWGGQRESDSVGDLWLWVKKKTCQKSLLCSLKVPRVVSGRNFESEEKRSSLTDVFVIVSSPY